MSVTLSSPANHNQLSQAETPRLPLSTKSEGHRLEGITQVHAAAVNGDKQTLSRQLSASTTEVDIGDQFGRSPLMYCVLADRLECAEILIKFGAQVNLRDKGGRTALHWAAHKGNLRLMKFLLSRGADCREKDNEGQTALHLCTRHKLPKCMALLLRQLTPGEIDDQDKNKRTALHWAASYGNLAHVKMLIKQDSNIGIPDTEGKTPLHWAASSRDKDAVSCVRMILETTPSVINWQDYEGRTALHLAVADGNESVVNVLTSVKNCNVSALDNVFRTPLHWAAVLGHSKIVAMLLDSGADSSSSDANGATALHYAAQNNYSETVSVFLSRNCTDEADLEGRTAFMWAAGKGADDVIRVFLAHNVDIQQEDKTGATALHAAALSGHSTTVKLLLVSGARLEVTDQPKHTPLFRACEMGHMDVVQTLIDCGARVDVLDQDGRSPLHWAALGGHAYICQMLIKYGLHPNVRDHSARAPLHCAAYGGYVNCMSALMEHGAEPNSQDKEGMTCLHWACSKGHLDAVKLLIEYNAFPNHMEFTEDRYTPLDYALMGEHHDVVQYMIEQGALSITGIQDIAAQKIQSAFRGYRVRKAFIERKKLLMKHEKLKKEAARKRAAEEGKRFGEDSQMKKMETASPPAQQQQSELQEQQQHMTEQPVLSQSALSECQEKEISYKTVQENSVSASSASDIQKHNDQRCSEPCQQQQCSKEKRLLRAGHDDDEYSVHHLRNSLENHQTKCLSKPKQEMKQSESLSESKQQTKCLSETKQQIKYLSESKPQIQCLGESKQQTKCLSELQPHIRQTQTQGSEYLSVSKQQTEQTNCLSEPKQDIEQSVCMTESKSQSEKTKCHSESKPQKEQSRNLNESKSQTEQSKCQCETKLQAEQSKKTSEWQISYQSEHMCSSDKCSRTDSLPKDLHRTSLQATGEHTQRSPTQLLKPNDSEKIMTSSITDKNFTPDSSLSKKDGQTNSSQTSIRSTKPAFEIKNSSKLSNGKSVTNQANLQDKSLTRKKPDRVIQKEKEAALTIQKAWRSFKHRHQANLTYHRDLQHRKRFTPTQEEWERQIAALTIQLAWRKYYRRKLLQAVRPNRRHLLMWDPEIIALKQQALVHYIYSAARPDSEAPSPKPNIHLTPGPQPLAFNHKPKTKFTDSSVKTGSYDTQKGMLHQKYSSTARKSSNFSYNMSKKS